MSRSTSFIKDRQGRPFVKSVRDIRVEYGEELAAFLHNEFKADSAKIDRSGTNITAALKLAREIVDEALAGSLAAWDVSSGVSLAKQAILTRFGQVLEVPNVRVIIYSDGAHTEGPLENAFESMQPVSILITASIGDLQAEDARLGAGQMKSLANNCPIHGCKGYFLIESSSPNSRNYLNRLLHMASCASGFCPLCMKGSMQFPHLKT